MSLTGIIIYNKKRLNENKKHYKASYKRSHQKAHHITYDDVEKLGKISLFE